MHGKPLPAAQAAAIEYCAHGWRIVPVSRRTKRPTDDGWPENHYEPGDIGDGNVGVILGPVSGHLCDVDIDSHWALELAPYFLPPTLTFGRASKPASHWLYVCEGARSIKRKFAREDSVEMIEIRAKNAANDKCGHQSVFPGSVHESGESIEWSEGCKHEEPQRVDAGELSWCVAKLTVASIIAEGWQEGSQRNAKSMAYAGGLLERGWSAEEVRDLLQAVREVAGDDEQSARKNEAAVERTILAYENGTKVTGFGSLVAEGVVDKSVVSDIERHAKTPAQLQRDLKLASTRAGKQLLERMIAEAQDTDAMMGVADRLAEIAQTGSAKVVTPTEGVSRLGRVVDFTTDAEPIKYVCEGLGIAPGKISSIGGYPGTGKGPFLDLFALCVASGRPFLGHAVERRKVCFLDAETGMLVETRLKRMCNALGIDRAALQEGEWLTLIHAQPPIDDEYCGLLETMLERDMLLCIDSYTSAVLGDQNDSTIAETAFRLGRMSSALGVSVVVATHEKKSQNGKRVDDLEMVSGHNALAASMQCAISLTRPDDTDKKLIEVRCARAPEEPFQTFRIRWEDVTEPEAKDTRGGKLKAEKWGLRAVVEASLEIAPMTVEEMRKAIEAEEGPLIAKMQAHYPGGQQVTVSELVGSSGNKNANNKRSAVRNLVQSGRLLANYHWKQGRGVQKKQLVWLPGPHSEIGVVQR